MRPLTLNLATRPFRNNTIIASGMTTVAVGLVLATVFNLYFFLNYGSSYAQLQRDQGEQRDRLKVLEEEERGLIEEIQKRDFDDAYERGRFASELIQKRTFSWTLLFNKLEQVMPPDVMMTAIRPNVGEDRIVIRVEGVAKDQGALLIFESRLLEHPSFTHVYPSGERKLNPQRPEINFIVNFDYRPQVGAGGDLIAEAGGGDGGAPDGSFSTPGLAAAARPPAAIEESSTDARERPVEHIVEGEDVVTVGRDGHPRTLEVVARRVVAPGGVFIPAEWNASKKSGDVSAPPPTTGDPAAGGGTRASEPKAAPGREPTTPGRGSPSTKAEGPPPPIPLGPDPPASAASYQTLASPPVRADRVDLDLKFDARPVGEVYEALARAHGVRFVIDPGVDRAAELTIDLEGRKLMDAILMVSGSMKHRVKKQGEGVYRVTALAGGAPMGDGQIREEDLGSGKVRP